MLAIDLKGKTALVTGGAGQLGRAMVRTLARSGANVAINYRGASKPKAEELVKEAVGLGVKAMAVQADVTVLEQVMAMRDKVTKELSAPDIIVTNAVIQYDWKTIMEQAPEDFESQFRSCVLHNVFMAKAFVPAMIEKKWGRVIGINTECAMQAFAGQAAYVSGKRGMDGIMRVLAREVGKHQITVNQVAPGWMISDRQRADGTTDQPGYTKSVPMGRRGDDQDIANLVAFLASDLAGFITGAYISVSGGNVMPAI